MGQPQHPWVERNLAKRIYNLADENIRYFYNNWVPLLAVRKIAIVPSKAVWRWNRGWPKNSPRCWKRAPTGKEAAAAGAHRVPLRRGDMYDPGRTITARRRPCTTASATISNRSSSSARVMTASRALSCP